MKYLPVTIRLRRGRRRGSVLVMAIVIITLLFMVGSTFLLTSRTTKQTVSAIDSTGSLDDGIDAVINRINTVLVEDLLGPSGGIASMLDGTAGNEYWDYPYTNASGFGTNDDMWLASMVPVSKIVSSNTYYYWPHITDLYGDLYGPFGGLNLLTGVAYYSPNSSDTTEWNGSALSDYYKIDFSNSSTGTGNIARVIRDNQSTEIIVQDGTTPSNPDHFRWSWGAQADADGDGISDSYWVRIPEITGPDGKNLYAAVRIIDNCGMINVNTAYLNSTDPDPLIGTKGANLTDVSLEGMPTNGVEDVNRVHSYRAQIDPSQIRTTIAYDQGSSTDPNYHHEFYYYNKSVLSFLDHRRLASVIPIDNLATDHFPLPFDLSDEIELRNRFCLDSPTLIPLEHTNRWESYLTAEPSKFHKIPYNDIDPLATGDDSVTRWYENLYWLATKHDRRHMLTAYSWDRTMRGYVFTAGAVTPAPVAGFADPSTGAAPITLENLQANINTATPAQIATALIYAYENIPAVGDFGDANARKKVAQLACNIVDYRDSDSTASHLNYNDSTGMVDVFGYDAHPLISSVRASIVADPVANYRVFEVTLLNPYPTSIESSEFYLRFCDTGGLQIAGTKDIVLPAVQLPSRTPTTIPTLVGDPNVFTPVGGTTYNTTLTTIALIQKVGVHDILIDKLPNNAFAAGNKDIPFYLSRTRLGVAYVKPIKERNSDIGNKKFNTVGEVTKVFAATIGPPVVPIGPPEIDPSVGVSALNPIQAQMANLPAGIDAGRLNIENEIDQNLLSRLTVLSRIGDTFDNNGDGTTDDRGELAMPGRININTAPQKVLEALPWVLDSALPVADREKLAQAIIAYRDNLDIPSGPQYKTNGRVVETGIAGVNPGPGFKYPAELINVTWTGSVGPDFPYDIRRQSKNATDLTGMPDTSPGDGAGNDLEERDVIFHRMSNLVTVRSDTFTAYIMVRLGEVGPQKRVIAIFDRSGVFTKNDVPRLVALHPVPDPR